MEKYCRAWQATYDNMVHVHCILDTQGYKHTLRICNNYFYSTSTMAVWMHPKVTLYIHCLSGMEHYLQTTWDITDWDRLHNGPGSWSPSSQTWRPGLIPAHYMRDMLWTSGTGTRFSPSSSVFPSTSCHQCSILIFLHLPKMLFSLNNWVCH